MSPTALMWPSQGLQNSRRLDKYKWLSPSQGSEGGIPLELVEALDNNDLVEFTGFIPFLIEDFVIAKDYVHTDIGQDVFTLRFSKGSADGQHFYTGDDASKLLKQYDMSTQYDLDTAATTAFSFDYSSTDITDFGFSSDGTILYILEGGFSQSLFSYDMSNTPWQLQGPDTLIHSEPLEPIAVFSFQFSTDGKILWLLGLVAGNPIQVRQYDLSIPFDISNIVFSGKSFDVPTFLLNVNKLAIDKTGTHMYISDESQDAIFSFTIDTPNDISTVNMIITKLRTKPFETVTTGMDLASDGISIFITGNTLPRRVIEFTAPFTTGLVEVIP